MILPLPKESYDATTSIGESWSLTTIGRIHEDFRKILSPKDDEQRLSDEISADLFGDAPEKCTFANFDIDSAFQGKEGLEMVKTSPRGRQSLWRCLC